MVKKSGPMMPMLTILPIGKYTIQARQIEAHSGNWTSPITFYTGNEAVYKDSVAVAKTNGSNQHSGDSPLPGGVNVPKGRIDLLQLHH